MTHSQPGVSCWVDVLTFDSIIFVHTDQFMVDTMTVRSISFAAPGCYLLLNSYGSDKTVLAYSLYHMTVC